jgi:hypothetical protein
MESRAALGTLALRLVNGDKKVPRRQLTRLARGRAICHSTIRAARTEDPAPKDLDGGLNVPLNVRIASKAPVAVV